MPSWRSYIDDKPKDDMECVVKFLIGDKFHFRILTSRKNGFQCLDTLYRVISSEWVNIDVVKHVVAWFYAEELHFIL